MNVLVAIAVAAVSLVGPASASSFVSLCQMDLKLSNRDLNSFFPTLVGTKSLSLLRYAGNWTGNGITDTCALILDGCENCGCSNLETPLLIQALGWSVQCETLPTNVVSAQQRTVDTSQTQTEEEPVHSDDHELTGTDPNQDTAQALLSDALNSDQSSDPYATPTATSTTTSTTDSSSDSDLQKRINEYMEVYSSTPDPSSTAGPRSLGGSDTPTAPKSEEPKAESPAQETSSTTKAPVEKSTEKEFFEVNPDTKETKKESGDTSAEKAEPTEATAPLSEFMDVFGQMSSWRSRYFVVLGFFIVFTIIFIVVIVVLYLKLKAARNGKPARSPGPGTDDVRTPLAGNEHSFQFSDNSLPR